jgi:hypothetical protein
LTRNFNVQNRILDRAGIPVGCLFARSRQSSETV